MATIYSNWTLKTLSHFKEILRKVSFDVIGYNMIQIENDGTPMATHHDGNSVISLDCSKALLMP